MTAPTGLPASPPAWAERLVPALTMVPAGLVWSLLEGDAIGIDAHVLFMLSLLVGTVGAVVVGGLSTLVHARSRLVLAAAICQAVVLLAFVSVSGAGDRAVLGLAEAAVRTGACASFLLLPSARRRVRPEQALLERGQWAAGGLMIGILAAELVPASGSVPMLVLMAVALAGLGAWTGWTRSHTAEGRGVSDGFREEST